MKRSLRLRWPIFFLTLVACVAGFFLRRAQLEAMQDNGAPASGSTAHIYLLILVVVTAAALALLIYPLQRQKSWRSVYAYRPLLYFIHLPGVVGLLIGNLVLLIAGQPDVAATATAPAISRVLGQLLAPMGLLSALCMAAFGYFCLRQKRPHPLLFIAGTLYLVVRLIVCFQLWNTDPWIHDYCYQHLAAVCCMISVIQLAGFSFDRGKRRITLFWLLLGVLFSAISVADHLRSGNSLDNLTNLSLLLLLAGCAMQLLFCDLRPEKLPEKLPEKETEARETPAQEQMPE